VYESGAIPLTVLGEDGETNQPRLKGGDDPISAFTAELQAAVNGVVAAKEPELLSARLARDALTLCFKECQSVRTGKAMTIS
jgi:hypothetical protein